MRPWNNHSDDDGERRTKWLCVGGIGLPAMVGPQGIRGSKEGMEKSSHKEAMPGDSCRERTDLLVHRRTVPTMSFHVEKVILTGNVLLSWPSLHNCMFLTTASASGREGYVIFTLTFPFDVFQDQQE